MPANGRADSSLSKKTSQLAGFVAVLQVDKLLPGRQLEIDADTALRGPVLPPLTVAALLQLNHMTVTPNAGGRGGSFVRELSDREWALVADLVPSFTGPGKIGRPAKHDRRDIVNAIVYVTVTGCPWRLLPRRYPHWNTVHRYYLRWCQDGTWQRISERLGIAATSGDHPRRDLRRRRRRRASRRLRRVGPTR